MKDFNMAKTSAVISTSHASRYLQQLCKHWSHRFSATFGPEHGKIDFGGDQSTELSATPSALTVTVIDAHGSDSLSELENVVEEHIKRFAFRETLAFKWEKLT